MFDLQQLTCFAIHEKYPGAEFSVHEKYETLTWMTDKYLKPTKEEFDTLVKNKKLAEPMRLLREERNRRIAQTDWRFRSDLTPNQEWIDYCQALRDLPANYSPTFDIVTEDDYPLVKEDNTAPWPEEPTDG